jgi:uncharacterized membrane protein
MTWTAFAIVFAAFFLTHSVPVRPGVKGPITDRIGARGFGMAYSALSLAMLVLLIRAAGEAPYVQLWAQQPWHRHVVHLGMMAVCLLLALSIARPNPLSFGGARGDRFDPSRPGIAGWTRHPVLAALALWAGLHLLANGDLAHAILFGVLGGFALAGSRIVDRRKQREMGAESWRSMTRAVAAAPRLHAPTSGCGLAARLSLGLAAYAALELLHPVFAGVAAF